MALFMQGLRFRVKKTDLNRKGDNEGIPYDFTMVKAPNGTKVAAPNCMFCHAQPWGDSVIIGLGNSTGDRKADLVPFRGYIAPPLDGVWITAPYLHNGSVPNLETLLNSKSRPTFWERNFSTPEYDYEKVGWVYQPRESQVNKSTYNTSLKGYGNSGHSFGDKLTDEERKAVIEYLKTL